MTYVAFPDDVAPGAACVIPEDKKIFRVTADRTDGRPVVEIHNGSLESSADSLPLLPVPHMYSA